MLGGIIRFELRYHFSRASTYVYIGIWFAISFLTMTLPQGGGRQLVDNPLSLAQSVAALSAFGVVVVSAISGMAVCRDFEFDVYPLFFTRPVRRRDYLAGRWIGSLLVCATIFAAIPLGQLAGTWMPWVDRTYRMSFRVWPFLQPYLLLVLPMVFWAGTLFFAIGALTRRVAVVYLQGALMLAVYVLSDVLMPQNLNDYWPALVDPFGMATLAQATKYWTIVERNTQLVPLAGVVLDNRLLWCGVGVLAALVVFRFFPFSAEALTARRGRVATPVGHVPRPASTLARPPVATPAFGRRTTLRQFATLTRLRVRTIVTDLVFLALASFVVVVQVGLLWGQPRVQDTPVYPVTYLMTASGEGAALLAIIITAIYAGEFVWRERQIRYGQIHDALPAPRWLNFASQFAALAGVQAVLMFAGILTGIVTQVSQGYYRFELGLYATEFFLLLYPYFLLWSVLALFIQTVAASKFLGHVIVIATFLAPEAILAPLASRLDVTFPANLYQWAGVPGYTYSDMNGYGPFVQPLAWFTTYWFLWAGLLIVGTIVFARRGTDEGWRVRLGQARARTQAPHVAIAALFLLAALGSGGWIYYNTRVLDEFVPAQTANARQARYEREYKRYQTLPQPKITAVDVRVEIYPRQGTFTAAGTLTLVNKTATTIPAIHVNGDEQLRSVTFDRPSTVTLADEDNHYWIHGLADPLEPGESTTLSFTAELENRGFGDSQQETSVVRNGTFFNSSFMPSIGYDPRSELTNEGERRRQGLGERQERPPPDDAGARMTQHFFPDSDWVSYHAIVGTDEDQVAMTPGHLVREWTENGRRYFEYDATDVRGLKFFSYLSARFEVKRDTWNGVDVAVYYHPAHPYNVDRMIASAEDGLAYLSQAFGPYQFRQFRVLEFPRYGTFAQSFANTVSYSEGLGFISNPVGDDDRDYPYYVTAHELAHQWWGHQLVGAATQGSNGLSESLAEYSAFLITEKKHGPAAMRLYLKHDLDGYLRGRAGEQRRERPLARAEAGYILYQKGSLALYALRDYLGADVVNGALRELLQKHGMQDPPYPTTLDLVAALRAVTPDDLQYLITDLFETITLYDNRALDASWRRTPAGKYAVTLRVQAGKVRADDQGNETPTPMDDLIDIGVFTGRGKAERALFLEKRRLIGGESVIEIVVDEQPARAGIDPYNKLIDRVSGDNVVAARGQ